MRQEGEKRTVKESDKSEGRGRQRSNDLWSAALSRRQFIGRSALLAGLLGGGATLLGACGGGEKEAAPSGTTAAATEAAGATSEAAGGATSAAVPAELGELQAGIEAARAIPPFVAPGPAFDASPARGKKVMYLSLDQSIPIVQVIADAVTEAAEAAGLELSIYDGKAQQARYVSGMQQAIAQGMDGILIESVASASIEQPIKEAREAGIKVIQLNELEPAVEVDGNVHFDYLGAAKLEADWVLVDSGGEGINVVVWIAPHPTHFAMRDTIQQEFEEYAVGDFKLQVEQVEFADWQTRSPVIARTLMTADPTINYFIPVVDGQSLFIVPFLDQAGYGDQVQISTFNATGAVLELLKKGDVVSADNGQDTVYAGWADIDQMLRVLTGQPTIDHVVPNRMFDQVNINEIDLEAPDTWFDNEANRAGFKQMWGVA
jgi:ribose transport system substrate-binding protein